MLWKKESNVQDALFVDLYETPANIPMKIYEQFLELEAADRKDLDDINFVARKDNKLAFQIRQEGNFAFANGQLGQAIERFNKSLCVAENGSEHIAKAYGNRATCYIFLGKLDNYLVDVELARRANLDYDLMKILESRKEQYDQMIAEGHIYWTAKIKEEKLSFPPNNRYPSLANILRVESNDKDGRYVKTTKDINVGQTILYEKCYVGETYTIKYETCAACFRSNTNLVPCPQCTYSMLCHNGCEHSEFHRIECAIRKYPIYGNDGTTVQKMPVLRSILMALKLFPNINNLMDFVEAAVTSDPLEIPSMSDEKAAYRSFLKIHHDKAKLSQETVFIFWTHKHLMDQPEISAKFRSEKRQRFLKHLIGHHLAIIMRNFNLDKVILMLPQQAVGVTISSYFVCIMNTYFNHSCAPNVVFYRDNGHLIGKVIRPIKKGEHLVSTYDTISAETGVRRNRLKYESGHDFWCECDRCNDKDSDERSVKRLSFNKDYFFALENSTRIIDFKCDAVRDETKKRCERFLQKYGRTALWNKELEFMMMTYSRSLSQWTSAPFSKYREIMCRMPTSLKCQLGMRSQK